jgi:KaiC/GvpD/RAD55 family RecA-like ATPase
MSIQRRLEVGILATAPQSRENMVLIVKALNGYQFSDQGLAWLWECYKKIWANTELPRLTLLEAQARSEPDEAQDVILEAIVEVWKTKPSATPQSDCDQMRQFQRHDTILKGMDRAGKAVSRGDLDGASAMLQRLVTDAAPATGIEVSSVLDFNDWNEHQNTRGLETGIRTYDEVTMGGQRPSDLGVIMGVTNMGKSILALNFGYNAFKRKRRTLHIDTENGLQETRVRYVARATRLPSRALTRRGLSYSDDFRRWAEGNQARIHEYLRILHIGIEQASLDEVEAKIEELCNDDWSPEQIIFDSPDHIVFDGDKSNQGMVARTVYARCKSIGQRYEACVWTVTQAKQEAEGKIATNKHAAWGYDKSRLADSVLTINPGLDEKGNPMSEKNMGNARCLFVSKARKTSGRFIIPLKTDFSTAYISEQLEGDKPDDDEEPGQTAS